jgi:hypothetical protein
MSHSSSICGRSMAPQLMYVSPDTKISVSRKLNNFFTPFLLLQSFQPISLSFRLHSTDRDDAVEH